MKALDSSVREGYRSICASFQARGMTLGLLELGAAADLAVALYGPDPDEDTAQELLGRLGLDEVDVHRAVS